MNKVIKKLDNGRVKVMTINKERSRTQQQFKDETDVNIIVGKYLKTGQWTHLARTQGVYADLTNVKDYQHALQTVMNAESAFHSLPSSLRTRFENDPQQLIKFLQNPSNKDEAIKLGLLNSPPEIQNTNTQNSTTTNSTNPKQTKTKTPPSPETTE